MTELFRFRSPLKRSVRRGIVIVTFVLLVAYVVLSFYGYRFNLQGLLLILVYWFLILRLMNASSTVMSTSFPFMNEEKKSLDERQQDLRNQAYYLAYLVAAPFAVLMGLLDFFGFGSTQRFYNQLGLTWLLIYVNMCLVISLPAMCTAWLEPDPFETEVKT